jgi:pimeloyl-ACP methyl ester carboxylesterase
MLFLHGIGLRAGAWRYQFALADRQRVLALDQRGHGRSRAGSAGYGLDPLADDLADVLRSLDLRDVVLVGHSMGGMTIMRFARRHADLLSERVAGLALVSTSADPVLGLGTAGSLRRVAAALQIPAARAGPTVKTTTSPPVFSARAIPMSSASIHFTA